MKFSLLLLAGLSILSQLPHADYVVKLGSNLKDTSWKFNFFGWKFENLPSPKRIQAGVFSGIIALAIMFTVLLQLHWVALGWVVIEAAIGCVYVFAANEYKEKHGNFKNPRKVEKFAGYFMAILIPICIYVFTFLYAEYDWILQMTQF